MEDKKTILVVDDEKDIREIIEIYLMNEGFNIVLACDGIEALEKLKKEDIDLIILDIMMPKLDGIRTCIKIREEKKMPIIMLSAKSEDSDKILGLNIGADDYIIKPFNPLELVARVKSQLRRVTSFSESKEIREEEIYIDGLRINKANREVYVDDKYVR